MIKIVNGKKLKGRVSDMDSPYFYGYGGRRTEQEYRQLLEDSQIYFKGISEGTILPTDKYFIYAPSWYLEHNIATEIAIIDEDRRNVVDANYLYILKHPIKVQASFGRYIYASDNGKHRFVVAQKYHLDLLVDVVKKSSWLKGIIN